MPCWLWGSWIIHPDGHETPLYGMLAETHWQTPLDNTIVQTILPSGAKLKRQEALIDNAAADSILAAMQAGASLGLAPHLGEAPTFPIAYMRDVIIPALGCEAVHSRCAYGLPAPSSLFPAPDDIRPIITSLRDELGFDFEGKLLTHLGGFDFFSLGADLDSPAPYGFEQSKKAADAIPCGGQILRFGKVDRDQTAQISIISEGETILDRLVPLPAGSTSVPVAVQGIMDSYCLRIFGGAQSDLEYQETAHFIRQVGGNMATPGRTVQFSDTLSRKAKSHGAKAAAKSQTATAINSTPISVEYDPTKLRNQRRLMAQAVGEAVAPLTHDRWFPRTFESEVGAIDYLNMLISSGLVQNAILVDPFLGADAFMRTIMRLTQTSVTLTIVTSWGRSDADTGVPIAGSQQEAEQKSVSVLSSLLDQAGAYAAPTLRVLNITTDSGHQAFHDRYLLLELVEGDVAVYLLSNSLNAMAQNWPYCVSQLTGRAKYETASYIKGLADGQDTASGTPPKVTFRWPKTHQAPA